MGLINNVEEVRKFIKLPQQYQEYALPVFDTAINEYLLPIIGQELYAEVLTYDENAGNEQKLLKELCQAVVANFGFLEDLIFKQVTMFDSGAGVTENESLRKLYKWELYELKEQLQKQGYAAQEGLITFLRANHATFNNWASSNYNSRTSFYIIRDGSDLSTVTGLMQPHRCYMMLRGLFSVVAETFIIPSIGSTFYEALNTKIIDASLSNTELKLVELLRSASARKVMQIAASEMNIRFSNSGFTLANNINDSAEPGREAASYTQIQTFVSNQSQLARQIMDHALEHLNKNASEAVFAEYYNSDKYIKPDDTSVKLPNSYDGLFVMR